MPVRRHCPQHTAEACKPKQPRQNTGRLEVLSVNLIHPQGFEELPNYLSGFCLSEKWINLLFHSLCFFYRRNVSAIEEVLLFLPRSDIIPSWGQQLPTYTVQSFGGLLLHLPVAPGTLQAFLQRDCSLLHSLPEDLSFCFRVHLRCHMLGRLVPICCLRSFLNKPALRRLVL